MEDESECDKLLAAVLQLATDKPGPRPWSHPHRWASDKAVTSLLLCFFGRYPRVRC